MLMAQAEILKREMALYPFTRSEIKTYNIPSGGKQWSMDNLFQDAIPNLVRIAIVESEAYTASNEKNPFEFKNLDLNYIDFQVASQSNANEVLQPDFHNNNYVRAYSRLHENISSNQKEPPYISYVDYKNGYTIYVFNLSQCKNADYSKPVKRGQTRLTLKFAKKLENPITVIAYGSFEAVMKVDSSRNVIVEG